MLALVMLHVAFGFTKKTLLGASGGRVDLKSTPTHFSLFGTGFQTKNK